MSFFEYLVDTAPLFLEATRITLTLTATALAIAMILGALVAAMSMSSVAVLRWIATGFIGVIRGTPLIAQIFVLYFGISGVLLLPAFWRGRSPWRFTTRLTSPRSSDPASSRSP